MNAYPFKTNAYPFKTNAYPFKRFDEAGVEDALDRQGSVVGWKRSLRGSGVEAAQANVARHRLQQTFGLRYRFRRIGLVERAEQRVVAVVPLVLEPREGAAEIARHDPGLDERSA